MGEQTLKLQASLEPTYMSVHEKPTDEGKKPTSEGVVDNKDGWEDRKDPTDV